MEKENTRIKEIVLSLPESPGIYQYLNSKEEIIYVGKAKNLKRRVSSYFNKFHDSPKVRVLVKQIADIKYIVVQTEQDALLLENSLIKKHQPRYNILLKDDKTYPWICVKNEHFPRVFKTRNVVKDGSRYFGPYTYIPAMKTVLELIHNLYSLRTCNLNLSPESIGQKRHKVCLQYHIKKCKGCCEGLQSEEEYNKNISEIKYILKGEIEVIEDYLTKEMMKAAEELRFEDAQIAKEKLDSIAKYRSKSTIVNPALTNIDVFAIEIDDDEAFVNFLKVTNGTISQAYTFEYKIRTDEEKEEILASAVVEMRERFGSKSREIIVPFEIGFDIENVSFTIPQRGDKKKLLELSQQNVKQYKFDRMKQMEKFNPEQRATKLMKEIQNRLRLEELPAHIECFDNSNIQGSDAVAACVVFKMAKPSKKDYRKYIIKTVEGPDDYASMREVVFRRYRRMMDEGEKLPNLIVADGGIGQMEIIRQVVEDELKLNIPIAGLAKDSKHKTREILFGFPPMVIGLDPSDQLFKFFANMQDEVHRFAIKFHREKRSKSQIKSELDIKGIGPKTKEMLLKKFKSVKRIKELTIEEMADEIGISKANIVYKHFNNEI
ncbi:MAG: excinuclease ABC subunit UvrC [Paludibacteraceae bacterium]|jgi:excinuclease ABC subunit C|nr:excinuclease ABC subunit UvrC [Paludibacteraceae bacterium]